MEFVALGAVVVDASAYKIYVAIAFRNQSVDVTASVVSFDAGGDVGSDGKLLFNGELVLGDGPDLPAICNPRNNPTMLYRGAAVIVECDRVDGGGRVRHPRGLLYVLSEPNEPTPSDPQIKFELGCQLSRDGDDDEPMPTLGGETEGEGGEGATASIGNPPSKFEKAANRLEYYYQTNQGVLAIGSNRLDRMPTRTFYLGQDEVEYRTGGVTGGGEGEELDGLRVMGVEKITTSNFTETDTTTTLIETGLANMINPDAGGSIITTRISTITEAVTIERRERTEVVLMAGGLACPTSRARDTGLMEAERGHTIHFYEEYGERRLHRVETRRSGALELVMKEFFDNQLTENEKKGGMGAGFVDSELSITEYTYAADGTVREIIEKTYKPLGSIVSDEGRLETDKDGNEYVAERIPYTSMVPFSVVHTMYKPMGGRVWQRTVTTSAPAITVREILFPDEEKSGKLSSNARAYIKAGLITTSSTVDVSNSGQTTPPAAERATEEFSVEERPIVVEVWSPPTAIAGAPAMPPGFDGTIPPPGARRAKFRDVQASELADIKEAIRVAQVKFAREMARLRTVEFQLPFDDDILTLTDPQPCWKFVHPDGSADIVLCEGMQFSHDAESAVVAASGIRLAMQLPGSNALHVPYPALAIEVQTSTATEDGSMIDPIDEIVIFPPPIIHRTSVVGYGIGTEDEYTIKPHRPAYFSEAYYGQGFEQDEFTNYPERTSSAGYALGRALTLGEKTIGIRHSHAGYATGCTTLKLNNLAPVSSTQGRAIGGLSTSPIKSVRGFADGFSATRDARPRIVSVRGYAEGFFVRPPTPRVLTVSVRAFSQGFVGTGLSRDRRSSTEHEAIGKVTRVTVVSRPQRGFALGRMLRRHTVIRPVKGVGLGKQTT